MSSVSDLTTRIESALAQIDYALTVPAAAPTINDGPAVNGTADEVAQLRAKLHEERSANAQLEDRVRLLRERQDGKLAELESNVDAGRARAARMDRELQRLREVNAELRGINAQLREAVAAGVSEPQLINSAMQAELDALRATRAADAAEMDMILQELTPIIAKEVPDATG